MKAPAPRHARISLRTLVVAGLAVSLLLAVVVSFYASGHPDGLEFVAHQLGFDTDATDHGASGSPLADYGVRGVGNSRLSEGLAGLVGVVLVGLLAFGLTHLLRRRGGAGRRER